ncbi:MAG TPA: phosphoglycerate kinase [Candidatus Krumholzibacteriaceae bacterium]|nr:phosphoglycerate kinase [Candidatus Krumholzibacteriaceae bacterium]
MAKFLTMDDFDFKNKTALVRVDFNSNIDPKTKKILEAPRIRAHGETTIKELVKKGAKVVILAHQGRPGDPDFAPLKAHTEYLSKVLGKPVKYVDDLFGEKAQKAIKELKSGEVLVLENVRNYPDELKKGTPEEQAKSEFVQKLAPLADVFVNDAFSAAHRAQISVVGFTVVLPSVAGRIMERELKALTKAVENPEKPCVYILGGAKADDALKISQYVLKNNIADQVLTGGVVGHLFLAAKGFDLGRPNMEFLQKKELMGFVPGIKALIGEYPERIEMPVDVAVEVDKKRKEISVKQLPTEYSIFDIGANTIEKYSKIIKNAKSIVFSGPVGVFENKEFEMGTKKIFEAIASSKAYSLIGGGDTVSAAEKFHLAQKMSYVSTAGGALIEFLMGEKLPGVVALEKAAARA